MNPRVTRLSPAEKETLCRLRDMLRRLPSAAEDNSSAPKKLARKPAADSTSQPR
jgi:hypothetical protein